MLSKQRFRRAFGSGVALLAAIMLVISMTGTVVAFPIAGIGGFDIQVEQLQGGEFHLYPSIAQTDKTDEYPQGAVEIDEATIDGLRLTKTFNLDFFTDTTTGNARVEITAGGFDGDGTVGTAVDDVQISGLLLQTSSLNATSATFNGLEIQERNTTELLSQPAPLSLSAPVANPDDPRLGRFTDVSTNSTTGIQLQESNIQGHYLLARSITLPNLELDVEFDPDNDGVFEFGDQDDNSGHL